MNAAIQLQQPQQIAQWKKPSEVKQRLEAIQQLLRDVLKPATKESGWDGDYGVIPGTGTKPSLLKAGSEQILAMFEIAVDPVVEDLSTEDCSRYRVTARLIHVPSGNFLGAGIGEASTNETKYKWKKTYVQKEFDATDPERRKIKHSQYKGRNDMWEDKQELLIRQEPADLANTVLKMAKKRAQIDATLTVTGASSMFSQDLEETAEDGQQEPPKATRGKKATQATSKTEDVKCASCGAINGHLPSCKHHPKNVSTGGQPVQGEVVAKETKKEADVPKALKQETVVVKSCSKKVSSKKTNYLELVVKDDQEQEVFRYVWHGHLQKEPSDLSTTVGKMCIWDVAESVVNGKIFFEVKAIHQIGTQVFVDDKPVDAPSAAEVGFENDPEQW